MSLTRKKKVGVSGKFNRVESFVKRYSAVLAVIGGIGLFFATAITCVSIIFKLVRAGLDATLGETFAIKYIPWLRSILGEEELVAYGTGLAIFAALPWVMVVRGHIEINLLTRKFGSRINCLLDLAGDLVFSVLAYLILTRQWYLIIRNPRGNRPGFFDYLFQGDFSRAFELVRTSQISQVIGIPLWFSYVLAEFLVGCFFLTALFCVIRDIVALKNISANKI